MSKTYAKVNFYQTDEGLFFRLEKPSTAGKEAIPFIFEGPATEGHKSEYAAQYKQFLKDNEKVVVPPPKVEIPRIPPLRSEGLTLGNQIIRG